MTQCAIRFFCVLLLIGCSSNDAPTIDVDAPVDVPDVVEDPLSYVLGADGTAVEVTLEPFQLIVERGGQELLRFEGDGLQLGTVSEYDPARIYDPWPMVAAETLYTPLDDLVWSSVTEAAVTTQVDDSITLALTLEGDLGATLVVSRTEAGRWTLTFGPAPDSGPLLAFVRLRAHADDKEGFYGLGEYFDDVNHRGRLRAMQIEVDANIESFYNEAHVPIPLVIGSTGWGLFAQTYLPAAFDLATQADDLIEITVGAGELMPAGLTFHLFAEAHPLDITKHYYDITGYPELPARWALGPWIWRDENKDQAQVVADIDAIRDLDLATTAIWIDRPYASGVNSFDFKADQFPEPQQMIDTAHALGLRMGLWHTPYVTDDDPDVAALHQEAVDKGYYPSLTGAATSKWGAPIDLTNPAAYDWWQGLINKYKAMGIEGYKLDYAEDIVLGVGDYRNVWAFSDGSDERTMHAAYQLLYHRVYAETLPATGGFLLSRHGTWGDQTITSVIWPGDLDADMSLHRELVVGDDGKEYFAVGGMPASMIAGIGLGASGYPFYGADTGGYRHSPPDKETFVRWFEQTALSSVMQVGTSSNDVAWEFNEQNGFDEESLDLYRKYARLHLRLWPYEWTYAQRIAETGRAIQRPMGLAYPEHGEHRWDQYMFGDDLLVAPVVVHGARKRDVFLPAGGWVDWWTGQVREGPQTIEVDAPLGTLPLFARQGAIIPMLRHTIDAMAPTTAKDRVDSYATTPGVLHVRIAPGADGAFEVFDGANLSQSAASGALTLTSSDGDEFTHGVLFEVYLAAAPKSVENNGAALSEAPGLDALSGVESGIFYDKAAAQLYVRVPSGDNTVVVQ